MSPEKMIGLSFAAAAAKLYEVFEQAEPSPRGQEPAGSLLSKKYYFFEEGIAA